MSATVSTSNCAKQACPSFACASSSTNRGRRHPRPRVIVVRYGNRQAGLVVDRIHGKCQTVIKPLGPLFAEVPAVSGCTIIGNGEVGMILDVPALVRHCAAGRRQADGACKQAVGDGINAQAAKTAG
jgi:two-component system chemotaxis sensor kinase CheA